MCKFLPLIIIFPICTLIADVLPPNATDADTSASTSLYEMEDYVAPSNTSWQIINDETASGSAIEAIGVSQLDAPDLENQIIIPFSVSTDELGIEFQVKALSDTDSTDSMWLRVKGDRYDGRWTKWNYGWSHTNGWNWRVWDTLDIPVGDYELQITKCESGFKLDQVAITKYSNELQINLLGGNPMILKDGTPYVEPGAIAHDALEDDITAQLILTGAVDTNTEGIYMVKYNAKNSSGFAAKEVTRVIVVSESHDEPYTSEIAAEIVPVSVEASSVYEDNESIHLIDASGRKNLTHTNTEHVISTISSPSMWLSDTNADTVQANDNTPEGLAWVTFDLGRSLAVSEIDIWNYNKSAGTDSGIDNIHIAYSTDGREWSDLGNNNGNYTIPEAGGLDNLPISLNIDLNNVRARYFTFTALTNHGGSHTGLSEVSFRSSQFESGQSYFSGNRFVEFIAGNSPLIISSPHGGDFESDNNYALADIPEDPDNITRDGDSLEFAVALNKAFKTKTYTQPHVIINHIAKDWCMITNYNDRDFPEFNDAIFHYNAFINIAKAQIAESWGAGFYLEIHTRYSLENQKIDIGHGISLSALDSFYTRSRTNWSNWIHTFRALELWRADTGLPEFDNWEYVFGETGMGGFLQSRGYEAIPSPLHPNNDAFGTSSYFLGGNLTNRHGYSESFDRFCSIHLETDRRYFNTVAERETYANDLSDYFKTLFETQYGFSFENPLLGGPPIFIKLADDDLKLHYLTPQSTSRAMYRVESSSDLDSWTPMIETDIQAAPLSPLIFDMSSQELLPENNSHLFFRVIELP